MYHFQTHQDINGMAAQPFIMDLMLGAELGYSPTYYLAQKMGVFAPVAYIPACITVPIGIALGFNVGAVHQAAHVMAQVTGLGDLSYTVDQVY